MAIFRIIESQNFWGWKGPLWVTQSNSLPKQGHPEQAAQHHVQAGLEYLQRRRLHSLPGQNLSESVTLQGKKFFLMIQKAVASREGEKVTGDFCPRKPVPPSTRASAPASLGPLSAAFPCGRARLRARVARGERRSGPQRRQPVQIGLEATQETLLRMQTKLPRVKIAKGKERRTGVAGAGSTVQRAPLPSDCFPPA